MLLNKWLCLSQVRFKRSLFQFHFHSYDGNTSTKGIFRNKKLYLDYKLESINLEKSRWDLQQLVTSYLHMGARGTNITSYVFACFLPEFSFLMQFRTPVREVSLHNGLYLPKLFNSQDNLSQSRQATKDNIDRNKDTQ